MKKVQIFSWSISNEKMHQNNNGWFVCLRKLRGKKIKTQYQWDRLLCSFTLLDPTALALLPVCSTFQASLMLLTLASTMPGTWCDPSEDCFISNLEILTKEKSVGILLLYNFVSASIVNFGLHLVQDNSMLPKVYLKKKKFTSLMSVM